MSKFKEITASVLRYLKKAGGWAVRLLAVALKMPTGRRIVAAGIVAALAAAGVKAPFEVVQSAVTEVSSWVGVDGFKLSLDAVIGLVLSIILADGTIRANDTVQDWKIKARPNRIYLHEIRDQFGPPMPSMITKIMGGQPRMTDYYEVSAAGELMATSTDGVTIVVAMPTAAEDQIRLYLIERSR